MDIGNCTDVHPLLFSFFTQKEKHSYLFLEFVPRLQLQSRPKVKVKLKVYTYLHLLAITIKILVLNDGTIFANVVAYFVFRLKQPKIAQYAIYLMQCYCHESQSKVYT